ARSRAWSRETTSSGRTRSQWELRPMVIESPNSSKIRPAWRPRKMLKVGATGLRPTTPRMADTAARFCDSSEGSCGAGDCFGRGAGVCFGFRSGDLKVSPSSEKTFRLIGKSGRGCEEDFFTAHLA